VLIEAGAEIDARDSEQATPLHWAAEDGFEPAARLLIEAGTQVDGRDDQQAAPLHLAVRKYQETVTRLLIEAGEMLTRAWTGRWPPCIWRLLRTMRRRCNY
jgi:ankyrin repeat protein